MSNHQKSHKRLTLILVCGVLLMFGFAYMLVPLYKLICQKEGINGRSGATASSMAGLSIDTTRTIKVTFLTTLHQHLPFTFKPVKPFLLIHPGERKLIYFYAENKTGHDMTVQAVPSITPGDAARFLKKTECFCFTQQYFFKGEKADMPVYFFVDPAIPSSIKEITLSYTLFDVGDFLKKQQHFTKGRIDL